VAIQAGPGVQGLYGAQVELTYNPTVVELLDIAPGPLLQGNGQRNQAGGFFRHVAIASSRGSAVLVVTLLKPALPTSNPGELARIVLLSKAEGASNLALSNVILSNQDSIEIPSQVEIQTPVQATTVVVPLVTGFNLIGVPIGTTTAKDLAQLIANQGGTVASIQRWGVGGSQTFDGWVSDLPDTNSFEIELGRGYFVKLSKVPTGGKLSLTGTAITQSASLSFVVGFNLVGIPFATPPSGYTAKSLAQAIDPSGLAKGGIVASIHRWAVGGSQTFDGWVSDLPDTNSFAIKPEAGYFIKLSEAGGITP
jgi:hypothetical protein